MQCSVDKKIAKFETPPKPGNDNIFKLKSRGPVEVTVKKLFLAQESILGGPNRE